MWQEARIGLILLEFFQISAQEVLSTYQVQMASWPLSGEERSRDAKGRSESKGSTPREAGRSRSNSIVSDWVNATSWVVRLDNEPTATVLAVSPENRLERSESRICRLVFKAQDWVKWSLAVRKDPMCWLGHVSMPILVGLERPVVMCRAERAGENGLLQELVLHWSVKERSNRSLLAVGTMLWQYRWRWHHGVDWSLGPMKKLSVVEWGNYSSAPLLGEWSTGSGLLEVCLRYTAQSRSTTCAWSEWSDCASVSLGISPPEPRALHVSLQDDPCRALLTWETSGAEAYQLEHRVQLKDDEEEWHEGHLVGWFESEKDFVHELTNLKSLGCLGFRSLPALRPGQSYMVRVDARYAGGAAWCGVETSFETLRRWPHEPSLAAPELLRQEDGEATKRFFRLPKGEVDLEWAREGQCWEKLAFVASDGVASIDISKLQNRCERESSLAMLSGLVWALIS